MKFNIKHIDKTFIITTGFLILFALFLGLNVNKSDKIETSYDHLIQIDFIKKDMRISEDRKGRF